MRKTSKRKGFEIRVLPACYLAALVFFLLSATFSICYDRTSVQHELHFEDAQLIEINIDGEGIYRTLGIDPGVVFYGVNSGTRLVFLRAEFERLPGEMELFYTRGTEGFSAGSRVIGVPVDEGYLYKLPPGGISSLRVDMGMHSENSVLIHGLTLNPHMPAWWYYIPNLRVLASLAAYPALAACVICTIIDRKRVSDEGVHNE